MRNIFLIILFVFFISVQLAMASTEREINIYKNIRCLVCQGQSLNDSNSDFAIDLKKKILSECLFLKISKSLKSKQKNSF